MRPEDVGEGQIDVELRHPQAGKGLKSQPRRDRHPWRDAAERHNHQERQPVAQAAGGNQRADDVVGVTAQVVEQAGEQRQRSVTKHPHDEGDGEADGKVAVEEQPWIEKRVLGRQAVTDENPQGYHSHGRDQQQCGRIEPVHSVAAIQN